MAGWLGALRQYLTNTLEKPILVSFLGAAADDCDLDSCVQMGQSPIQRVIGGYVVSMLGLFGPYHTELLRRLLHVYDCTIGRNSLVIQHPNDRSENFEVSGQALEALERSLAHDSRVEAELVRNGRYLPSQAETQAKMRQDRVEAEIDEYRRAHRPTALSRLPAHALALFVRHVFVSWLTLPFEVLLARAVMKRRWNGAGVAQRVSTVHLQGPQPAIPITSRLGTLKRKEAGALLERVLVCGAMEVVLGMGYVLCEAFVVVSIQKLVLWRREHGKGTDSVK